MNCNKSNIYGGARRLVLHSLQSDEGSFQRSPGLRSAVCRLRSSVFSLKSKVCRPQAAGFTLIELLVVVAIIAILMGLSFPAIQGAIHRARMTRARSEVRSLQQAWLAYWNTYYDPVEDVLPPFWPASVQMDAATVEILAGDDTSANPQGIVFMEFDEVHLDEGFFSPLRGDDGQFSPYVVELQGDVTQESEWTFKTRVFLGNAARDRY